ncbi:uncharacterized protein PADG_11219 [Paracoccidioides brasiliensis Pb18]|uniref:Uncharacterized protein n=1 Tax=Paracoccidioides brasiliensis (strain Pb18) TaxID=502780 RepID=A0A0A0HXI0_PARBD|nr:uncharacterized protein PADG_11219 [Paracoccidioides brasiliensis Pb18]KGM92761.1 hypothetical protein PADG_11219 [Paracoccidioides brasiliensis Pb18]
MAISDSESFCNDGTEESWIILTGLPCLFREQFPKMPKDHIARLIFDRHRQNASGGYWRNLISRQKDTGRISWPINFKDYVKASSPGYIKDCEGGTLMQTLHASPKITSSRNRAFPEEKPHHPPVASAADDGALSLQQIHSPSLRSGQRAGLQTCIHSPREPRCGPSSQ